MSIEKSGALFELKMLINLRNRNKNNQNHYYLTPIEERQKRFFDYYKNLFYEMKKMGALDIIQIELFLIF